MSSTAQHLGSLSGRVEEHLADSRDRYVEGLRGKDPSLWSEQPLPELADRLGWLDLPATPATELARWTRFAEEIAAEGFQRAIVLGMGGSSLAPEVLSRMFGAAPGFPQLEVLDSTHPAAVREALDRAPIEKTLCLVSSKSGSTVETLSFFRSFWASAQREVAHPQHHFVAITDPGSSLERLAQERRFRAVFPGRSDVGGRFSALSAFGMVPAALLGLDLESLFRGARQELEDLSAAVALGVVLGEAALAGRDKLTLLTDAAWSPFPVWVEQLVAESTGKDGRGIVPIVGEESLPVGEYGGDRLFVGVAAAPEDDLEARCEALAEQDHPVVVGRSQGLEGLGREFVRWEVATAVAGAVLSVHPFDQPDVQRAKEAAQEALQRRVTGSQGEEAESGVAGNGKPASPAMDAVVSAGPGDELLEAVASWGEMLSPTEYLAVQAYLAPHAATDAALRQLVSHLQVGGNAASVAYGPRFLHSTGQLHKGGPNHGRFLQLLDRPDEDLSIPETDLTYGELIAAQAEGDAVALSDRGRRLLRVRLDGS